MRRSRFRSSLLAAVSLAIPPPTAFAGAFLLPEGQGQLIAGVGYTEGSRRFEPSGQVVAAPTVRKLEAGGYLEYGVTSWLSLIAAPTLAHETGVPATNTVTGSDSSAFGARLQLLGGAGSVLAVQALVQPPIGAGGTAAQLAEGGARSLAVDLRVLGGQLHPVRPGSLRRRRARRPALRRSPAQRGAARSRLRRAPVARLLVLVQDFSVLAPARRPARSSTSYSKGQASLVYDFSTRWSGQVGVVRTIAGRNALRETGPLFAVWYRF